MNIKNFISGLALTVMLTVGAGTATAQQNDNIHFLSPAHAMVMAEQGSKYLLLPVEEKADICHIRVNANGKLEQTLNVRLAVDNIDYYVPLDLSSYKDKGVVLDIHNNGNNRNEGALKEFACWKNLKYTDTFETSNREKFRPTYHHTPVYGWMNDPNGLFYKDGEWHLYYQHNPYGSQWENMHWRHSVSRDLMTWEDCGEALAPDGLGTIFSGCCVVDNDNTAGLGNGAIIAFYTSAGENQTQCMAYSTDNGQTFTKYPGNPVITSNVPDFRDPHVFWHKETARWIMILAAGQEMNIYSSADLKSWKYESAFGHGYGNHDGVWECPDLMKFPVAGTDKEKWMLVCNINPGGPSGGSATQYFTGEFDGHKFVCDTKPEVTKWMDYGKDHYAAVTFDNAPDNRHVIIAWMSNWQYANQVPTMQYRSGNSIARDLHLYEYNGDTFVGVVPSKEVDAKRGKAVVKNFSGKKKTFDAVDGAYEMVLNLSARPKTPLTLTLQNAKGEKVSMTYNADESTFSMDRTQSGETSFSDAFAAVTTAPVNGEMRTLRLFFDKCSIEAFDGEGKMAMSNLVFPSEPYNTITVSGGKGCKVSTTVYHIK
ncbi:MAG: DUF4980 domain-containing protein [Prevotella sp.]